MDIYYKDYQGNDESFWEHEWGKHGTCISTLEPSCYTNYQPQEEVADYFQQIVNLFQQLPTYQVSLTCASVVRLLIMSVASQRRYHSVIVNYLQLCRYPGSTKIGIRI